MKIPCQDLKVMKTDPKNADFYIIFQLRGPIKLTVNENINRFNR